MNKTKPLNILVSNREALQAATTPLRGWAHSAEEVGEVADLAEARLDQMLMPKSKRKGIIAIHVSKGSPYRLAVIGTAVTLRRAADGWRVISFKTGWAHYQQRGKLQLRISSDQEAAAVEAMRAACGIVVTQSDAKGSSSDCQIAREPLKRKGRSRRLDNGMKRFE